LYDERCALRAASEDKVAVDCREELMGEEVVFSKFRAKALISKILPESSCFDDGGVRLEDSLANMNSALGTLGDEQEGTSVSVFEERRVLRAIALERPVPVMLVVEIERRNGSRN
jgi:hypothetical protein